MSYYFLVEKTRLLEGPFGDLNYGSDYMLTQLENGDSIQVLKVEKRCRKVLSEMFEVIPNRKEN